ncbi:conserved hypothetical protein [Mesorhizobium escarrei]|uniref:Uncharacterized protein n=1 Tax=Mesorhizobium escarrei TaxID=666018 RepID=A0ABM9DU10_9HYPH|nr:conserved hypothetical protein [Mesorhizobium escarrei]
MRRLRTSRPEPAPMAAPTSAPLPPSIRPPARAPTPAPTPTSCSVVLQPLTAITATMAIIIFRIGSLLAFVLVAPLVTYHAKKRFACSISFLAKIIFFGARAARGKLKAGDLHGSIERAVRAHVPDDLVVIILKRRIDGKAFGNDARSLTLHIVQGKRTRGGALLSGFENAHRYGQFATLGHRVRAADDEQHGSDMFHGGAPPAIERATSAKVPAMQVGATDWRNRPA